MNLDRAMTAAREYRNLLKLNSDIRQLSGRSLAEKLGYSRRHISKAEQGIKPECMTQEDFDLIHECVSERVRLERQKNGETRESLLRKHKITTMTLMEAMEYV